MSEAGEPYVLEVNSIAALGWTGSFLRAAAAAGYSFTEVVCRIVDVARERYRSEGASQESSERSRTSSSRLTAGPATSSGTTGRTGATGSP